MKNTIRNAVIILASSLLLNAAQAADGNGGLMAELMSKKYQVQPITNAAAQARLEQVQIRDESHGNGGLMRELTTYRVSIHADKKTQERLAQVKLPSESGNGGLMRELLHSGV